MGQPRVYPVPGSGDRRPVPGSQRGGDGLRGRPGRRVGERQLPAVLAGAARGVRLARRRGQLHHPVTAQPAQHLGGQIRQQERQPGHVISGIEDNQDGRVPLPPVPGLDQPGDDVTDLGGGLGGRIEGPGSLAAGAATISSAQSPKPFIAPPVPMGMKAGVRTAPCGVVRRPMHSLPSRSSSLI